MQHNNSKNVTKNVNKLVEIIVPECQKLGKTYHNLSPKEWRTGWDYEQVRIGRF